MEPNQDAPEVLETPVEEQATEQPAEENSEPKQEEDIEALKAKAAMADELEKKNKQLFERIKKQEQKTSGDLSNKDVLYLAKADIHEDDLDDVVEMARLKKVSVADAHSFMKPILQSRAEERRTAEATQVKSGRGVAKISGADVLARFEKGEMPDSDEAIEALAAARLNRFRSKKR